jgi:processive 1,2-diacylglycerol beta-glucosyltransferase
MPLTRHGSIPTLLFIRFMIRLTPFMLNKVLVLSASAGAGHVRAAQAVERAFVEMNAAGEVRHIDVLQYTNKIFRHLYSKAYIEMVNKTPELLGWLYDALDTPWKNERRRFALPL